MRFLALERETPGTPAGAFAPHLEAEARAVWAGVRSGLVRDVAFDADAHTAVLTLEARDRAEAQAWLDGLPLVAAGLIRFDLVGLAPYTGYERLFREEPVQVGVRAALGAPAERDKEIAAGRSRDYVQGD